MLVTQAGDWDRGHEDVTRDLSTLHSQAGEQVPPLSGELEKHSIAQGSGLRAPGSGLGLSQGSGLRAGPFSGEPGAQGTKPAGLELQGRGAHAYGVLDRLSGGSGRRGGSPGSVESGCAVGDTDSRTPVETGGLHGTRLARLPQIPAPSGARVGPSDGPVRGPEPGTEDSGSRVDPERQRRCSKQHAVRGAHSGRAPDGQAGTARRASAGERRGTPFCPDQGRTDPQDVDGP